MTSICRDCAIAKGAKDIKGHVCTMWVGKCSICHEKKACVDESDYLMPGKKPTLAEWD